MKKRQIKAHNFGGRRYQIRFGHAKILKKYRAHALCDPPTKKQPFMTFGNELKKMGRFELITYLHEPLHALNFAWTEKEVEKMAKELGSFLWRLGYRKN